MLELLEAQLPEPATGWFTTRTGGVSAPPWDGLNLALHVADAQDRVHANRDLLARRVGVHPSDLVFAQQPHGSAVTEVTGSSRGLRAGVRGVDALVTRRTGLALVVLAADCLPVLLADPNAAVVAAAHAGREGLRSGVLQQTLATMRDCGATPADTTAVLGPAVCGRCYELPEHTADEVARQVPGSRATTRAGTPSVDLAAGAQALLEREGVGRVRRVGGCTLEQPDRFFSHRREGVTGRHAGVVRLIG